MLRARVAAPPVEGAANQALLRLLADELGVARRAVRLVAGAAGRQKLVVVEGMTPGEILLIDAPLPVMPGTPGVIPLNSGVMVMYADDESFTFMTPQGHMFAGWITFSGLAEGAETTAQIQVLIRPNDPIYELGWFVMRRMEDRFWKATIAVKIERNHVHSSNDPCCPPHSAVNLYTVGSAKLV